MNLLNLHHRPVRHALLARTSNLRRRHTTVPRPLSSPHEPADLPRAPIHRIRGLIVDCETRRVSVGGQQLKLTCMEFELLAHLMANRRRVYSREQLMALVWQQTAVGDMRTVDVHIARLRRKLGPGHRALIRTVRQVGYAFEPSATARPRP
ncbi:winged helix-turn-helix domain-containing protein [Streptomyces sp. NPDC056149]|uniref:winged helix-turn-helix domain-containing protein n=1 Tax=unclassified Streptomyces TaxID=2593676 RepID=UPI002381710A|nr:response regulator transcription factor [Streptomyces sp. WZ-12]